MIKVNNFFSALQVKCGTVCFVFVPEQRASCAAALHHGEQSARQSAWHMPPVFTFVSVVCRRGPLSWHHITGLLREARAKHRDLLTPGRRPPASSNILHLLHCCFIHVEWSCVSQCTCICVCVCACRNRAPLSTSPLRPLPKIPPWYWIMFPAYKWLHVWNRLPFFPAFSTAALNSFSLNHTIKLEFKLEQQWSY